MTKQYLLQKLWGCTSLHTHSEYWKERTSSAATLRSAVQSYSAALLQKKEVDMSTDSRTPQRSTVE